MPQRSSRQVRLTKVGAIVGERSIERDDLEVERLGDVGPVVGVEVHVVVDRVERAVRMSRKRPLLEVDAVGVRRHQRAIVGAFEVSDALERGAVVHLELVRLSVVVLIGDDDVAIARTGLVEDDPFDIELKVRLTVRHAGVLALEVEDTDTVHALPRRPPLVPADMDAVVRGVDENRLDDVQLVVSRLIAEGVDELGSEHVTVLDKTVPLDLVCRLAIRHDDEVILAVMVRTEASTENTRRAEVPRRELPEVGQLGETKYLHAAVELLTDQEDVHELVLEGDVVDDPDRVRSIELPLLVAVLVPADEVHRRVGSTGRG